MLKDEAERTGNAMDALTREFVLKYRSGSLVHRASDVDEMGNRRFFACSQQASATASTKRSVDTGAIKDTI
jgi:hypothetical protein